MCGRARSWLPRRAPARGLVAIVLMALSLALVLGWGTMLSRASDIVSSRASAVGHFAGKVDVSHATASEVARSTGDGHRQTGVASVRAANLQASGAYGFPCADNAHASSCTSGSCVSALVATSGETSTDPVTGWIDGPRHRIRPAIILRSFKPPRAVI